MSKLKQPWVKTAIPKALKIELFRVMRDNPTQKAREVAVANSEAIESLEKLLDTQAPISRDTFKRLKSEITGMPYSEVLLLPKDLQDWILELRPDLKQELGKQEIEQSKKPTNWIDDHRLKQGELPLIPDWLAPIVIGYSQGIRVSKEMKLSHSPPYWDNLKPSQRKQLLQLVEWLGQDKDDYIDMINKYRPGRLDQIRITWKK